MIGRFPGQIPILALATTLSSVHAGQVDVAALQSQLSTGGTLATVNPDDGWMDFCPEGTAEEFPQGVVVRDEYLVWDENACRRCLLGDLHIFQDASFPIILQVHSFQAPSNIPSSMEFPQTFTSAMDLVELLVPNCWHIEERASYDEGTHTHNLHWSQQWTCDCTLCSKTGNAPILEG